MTVAARKTMTSAQQRDYVRELAHEIAEWANSPEMAMIRRRWRDVNERRRPDRVPVWCKPVGCWTELLPEEDLQCTDQRLMDYERSLRRMRIKQEIGDDSVVETSWSVDAMFDCNPTNTWGVDVGRVHSTERVGAWTYKPPVQTEGDLDRLVVPRFTLNREATDRRLNTHHELMGDILPGKLTCHTPITASIGTIAANLRGLQETMMDMAIAPELMHRLMAYARDCKLQAMTDAEATGLLTTNNVGVMYHCDPVGPDTGRNTSSNCIVAENSQEFDQVSPAMWEEFCLNYQKPIFERCARVAYGCCENLTTKIDGVLSIPNLWIFVCSAWTDLQKVIDATGDQYTIMWRQKASDVVMSDNTDRIRNHLQQGCRELQGCHYQIVLRELQTLAGHPRRLHDWTRIAIDTAERNS